jgi:hypothetical protein
VFNLYAVASPTMPPPTIIKLSLNEGHNFFFNQINNNRFKTLVDIDFY